MRILHVEDISTWSGIVQETLEKRYEVEIDVCESCEEATQKLNAAKYDLIISDMVVTNEDVAIPRVYHMARISSLNEDTPVLGFADSSPAESAVSTDDWDNFRFLSKRRSADLNGYVEKLLQGNAVKVGRDGREKGIRI